MSFSLYENYRSLAHAILIQYIRDYLNSYRYVRKHTRASIEDKLKRANSSLRKANSEFGYDSKEYKAALSTVNHFYYQREKFILSEQLLEEAEEDLLNGSLQTFLALLGYKLEPDDVLAKLHEMSSQKYRRLMRYQRTERNNS